MRIKFWDEGMHLAYIVRFYKVGYGDYFDMYDFISKAQRLRPGCEVSTGMDKEMFSYPALERMENDASGNRVYRFSAKTDFMYGRGKEIHSPTFTIETIQKYYDEEMIVLTDPKARTTFMCLELLEKLIDYWKLSIGYPDEFKRVNGTNKSVLLYNMAGTKIYLRSPEKGKFIFVAKSIFEREEYESYPFY